MPSLALAQTCRQIRYEYRPICLKAYVTIDWRDVPSYFETFFPTRDGNVSNIDLAPRGMTVLTNTFRKRDDVRTPVEIDILPIVKIGLIDKNFTCRFKFDERWIVGENIGVEIKNMIAADVKTLQSLLTHRHQEWVGDVMAGRVHRLMVSHIATESYPRAQFFLGSGKDNTVPSEFVHGGQEKLTEYPNITHHGEQSMSSHSIGVSDSTERYVRRVELHDIFMDNDYVFLWNVDWECSGQNNKSSPVSFPLDTN